MAASEMYEPTTGAGADPNKPKKSALPAPPPPPPGVQDPSIDPHTGQPYAAFNGISQTDADKLANTDAFSYMPPDQLAYGTDVTPEDYAASSPAAAVAANLPYKPKADVPTPGVLSGPGPAEQWLAEHQGEFDKPSAAEDFYTTHGKDLMDTKSAAETLYDQGMAGTDPYYAYAQQKAERAINDAGAARGNVNSSAVMYDIGDSAARLRGEQAAGMKDLAALSDRGRLDRYAGTGIMSNDSDQGHHNRVSDAKSMYDDWQTKQENRLGGAQSTSTELSKDQANTISSAFSKAGDLSNTDNLEAFNAELQKLGIDPTSSFVKDFITTLKTAGSAATAA